MKLPLQEQTLYSAITFRRLLDSLARPGKINQLEYPNFVGELPGYHLRARKTAMPVNLYALGAMLTLLDREVTFVVAADGQWLADVAPLIQWLALRSGSAVAAPASAQFAFFCQGRSDGLVTQLSRGTLLEPEASATAFYCVEWLLQYPLTDRRNEENLTPLPASPDAGHSSRTIPNRSSGFALGEITDKDEESLNGVTLELTGPGIEFTHNVSVLGMNRDEVKLVNSTRGNYPLGIDMYLIDDLGRCIGLPRTTRIKLLEKER